MTNEECRESARRQVLEGIEGEQWMVAVIRVEDGKVALHETSCNFPIREHPAAQHLFSQALLKKIPLEPPQLDPLPLAPHLQDGFGLGVDRAPLN